MDDLKTNSAEVNAEQMLDTCIFYHVRKASREISKFYDRNYKQVGIKSNQLVFLVIIKKLGTATQADISDELSMDQTTVSRNLQLLKNKGWIDCIQNKQEREGRVKLSKLGEEKILQAFPAWKKNLEATLDIFESQKHIDELIHLIRKAKNFQSMT